jgi:glycosyltransferase involved in cell wall biosynthesis
VRIALVTSHFPPSIGGLEKHVVELGRAMAERGHAVDVLVPGAATRVEPGSDHAGVVVRRFRTIVGGPRHPIAPGLWRHLRHEAAIYDVVHAHNYHALPALATAACGARALVFTPHYHGTGHSASSRLLHALYRPAGQTLFAHAQAVICVSRAEASLVSEHFPECASRITIIHNGLRVQELQAAQPLALQGPMILTVGRLERYKNVQRILEALRHLPPDWRLCVIGYGPDRPRLQRRAHLLQVAARVSWLDPVDDDHLRRWLRTATVYASMSAHEAFGLAVAEAIAAGTAVVASDIPPHRELIELLHPRQFSLVAQDGSATAVAKAIARMRGPAQPPLSARRCLSWERMAEATLGVYERVLEPGRALKMAPPRSATGIGVVSRTAR